jgi:adenylyltransferase/sulfurtransferase
MDRYSRQELFIGKKAQKILEKSTVAIVGVGALGTTAANLCVRAGISVTLFDKDIVEMHNLQRQTIFTEQDIGKSKALQAATYLKKVNSEVSIHAHKKEINPQTASLLMGFDIIFDCTDNMETRFLLNDFCVKNKKQWIYASAVGSHGMIYTYIPGKPCFRCIFSSSLLLEKCEKCDAIGILNTIPAVIAAIQVSEAIQLLTMHCCTAEIIAYDIMKQDFKKIRIKQKNNCLCCQKKRFEFL